MRKALAIVAALVVVLALVGSVGAGDKEVTLKGTLVCAKCTLKEKGVTECTNVLQVKEGGKMVNYFIKDTGKGESYHKGICPAGKTADAEVKGKVTEKDGKKWIEGKVTVK
jgi:hypothetical protein